MPVSIQQFWNLAVQAQVLAPHDAQQLAAQWASFPGALPSGDATTLMEWLISEGRLTRYQAKVLSMGQPGPFAYGEYQVFDRIEQGRLKGLFRAAHVPTGHTVMLTFVTGPAAEPANFARLWQLCTEAAAIRSPYVQRSYQAVDLGSHKFIVLEDLQGQSLREAIKLAPLPAKEACRLMRQAALGLDVVHAAFGVYGEVRPENVWLDVAGHARLLAFPLHRPPLAGPYTGIDLEGRSSTAGNYLAPEVAAGSPPDLQSDVFGMGCTLYHAIAGQSPINAAARRSAPFSGGDPIAPLSMRAGDCPQPISDVVSYLTQPDPSRRYQSAANVAEALRPYVGKGAETETVPQASPTVQAYESWLAHQAQAFPLGMATVVQPRAAQSMVDKSAAAQPGIAQPATQAFAAASRPVLVTPTQPIAGMAAEPAFPAINVAGESSSPAPSRAVAANRPASSASSAVASRRAKQAADRKNRGVTIVCGVILLAAAVVVAIISGGGEEDESRASGNGGNDPPVRNTSGQGSTSTNSTTNNSVGSGGTSTQGEDGAGEERPTFAPSVLPPSNEPEIHLTSGDAAWDPPTAGEPLDFSYIPSGVQMLIALRPAELFAHDEGRRMLGEGEDAALRPLGGLAESIQQDLQQVVLLPLEEVEQVIIGLQMAEEIGKPLVVSMTMRTVQPDAKKKVLALLQGAKAEKLGEHEVHVAADGLAYYFPADQPNLVVAASSKPLGVRAPMGKDFSDPPPIEDAIARADVSEAHSTLRSLQAFTDRDRQVTVLFAQQFLFTAGKVMWTGPAEGFLKPMQIFFERLGDVKACVFSLHFSDDALFMEARLHPSADKAPVDLAADFGNEINALPRRVRSFVLSVHPSDFSMPVLLQFEDMLRRVAAETTLGTTGEKGAKHVIARCYLPARAASNLSYATYLTMLEQNGGGGGAAGPAAATEWKTAEEILANKKMTLKFPRDTLEQTMIMISDEIGVAIKILGPDLQLDGITKNQSFGLDLTDKTAGEVLRDVLKKANPDGKLIYVIQKDGEGREVINVTTRAAAAKRGDTLPKEFEEKKE